MSKSVAAGIAAAAVIIGAIAWSSRPPVLDVSPAPEATVKPLAAPTTVRSRLPAPPKSTKPTPPPTKLSKTLWEQAQAFDAMPLDAHGRERFEGQQAAKQAALRKLQADLHKLAKDDDPQTATEANLMLGAAFESMGHAYIEAPIPADIEPAAKDEFVKQMNTAAYQSFAQAQRMLSRAIETADGFPEGHPVHAAVSERMNNVARAKQPVRPAPAIRPR